MKLRIGIWAGAGALVVIFWTLYISATVSSARGTMWTLAYLTCPIALARHFAISFYVVLLVNAATYAFVGAAVKAIRRHFQRSRMAHSQ